MGNDTPAAAGPVRLRETLSALVRARAVLLAIALLAALWSAHVHLIDGVTPPDRSEGWQSDCDLVMLKQGIDAAPRFRDTGRWWTGQWIGCNPFWRPLSSYAFWTMWKVFGWEHHDRFALVLVVCHLVASTWLFVLIEAVTGRAGVACLSVVMYSLGLSIGRYDIVCGRGLGYLQAWVYAPDAWMAMCALPALWATWRGKLWWAVGAAAMAAGFKETGFVVFPLVGVLYFWRFRRWHRAVWALIALAALMTTVRLVFVGPGWVMGSNHAMLRRMYVFLAGEPLVVLAGPYSPAAIIGIGAAVSVIGWRKTWLRYGGIPPAVLAASLVAWRIGLDLDPSAPYVVSLCRALDWKWIGPTAVEVAVWVVAAYAGIKGPDRRLIVLFVLGYWALGLPATVAPQTGIRSLYTAYMMSSAAAALCTWAMGAALLNAIRERVAGRGQIVGDDDGPAVAPGDA